MQEIWQKWEPISGLETRYDIKSIKHIIGGYLEVIFFRCRWEPINEKEDIVFLEYGIKGCTHELVTDTKKQVVVTFENGIFAYRETDETFRSSTFGWLTDRYDISSHRHTKYHFNPGNYHYPYRHFNIQVHQNKKSNSYYS